MHYKDVYDCYCAISLSYLCVHMTPCIYTIVSEIFAGGNFHKFHEGQVHENLCVKFNMGRYKMAAFLSKADFHLSVMEIDNNP